jgi:ribosome-associated toxin RatA of RatAB toxin-antitoxin module
MRAAPIVLASGLLLAFGAGAASAQDDAYRGITWDSIPAEGAAVSWGRAVAVVDQPIDRVLEVVHAYDQYNQFIPHFRTSRILSRRGDDALVYMEVGVARDTVTLWGQMRILSHENQDRSRVVEATMMRGNMNQFRARWVLTPIDDGARTRVEFRILVAPDMPLPSSIFTQENVKAARKTVRALRERLGAVVG